ncbi:hypothetical protein NDA11_000282 [Ustilago hordei]|uniref:RING-type domain-containing protein n=1 Tax=Ustilago hordei TaxID=120017 RepID=I2FSB5_USTHO|nr:uncharacterized protein UHO2_05794 [Ustilago hordei]KAJ1042024.1 hypothetical protein NDA10_001485 [Ustilago hordei]KAJ1573301.1 hypothetical protein NDA15_003788 [Ustilago hordei]KAJ1574650.1 hypothetical protein NDA12_000230 [Ustilago hordei]KAJ1576568.1 hypothetical protein NDA11_000282 [Ustilago hordei]KAJ1596302.1 hypothetical protein NDA14_003499 [Ustilago hordei]
MGCSICLDGFDEEQGDAMRGTALPCGHIFHWSCLESWFFGPSAVNTSRSNNRRCPLCSKQTNPASRIKLFPSDGEDLTTYLDGQRQQSMPAINENGDLIEDAEENVPRYNQLLNDLIDFNTSIQNYVMAVHTTRLDYVYKSGIRIRKLIVDLTKDTGQEASESLMLALDALENAAAEFKNLMNDLNRSVRRNRQLKTKLDKEGKEAQEKKEQADQKLKDAHVKVADAERRLMEANRRAHDVELMQARHKDLLATIWTEQEALKRKEAELRSQNNKVQLETNLKLSNMKHQTERQLVDMREKMEEALRKCAAAEKERILVHDKNCILADQLRIKNTKKNLAPPGASAAKSGGMAEKDRRIRALEVELENKTKLLEELVGITPSQRRTVRNTKNIDANVLVDLTRSSNPLEHSKHDSRATPRDGFQIGSQASTSAAIAPPATGKRGSASPTTQRKGRKRARTSLSVEPERLDDEDDDAQFPMPGQGAPARVQGSGKPYPPMQALLEMVQRKPTPTNQASSTSAEAPGPATETSKPPTSANAGQKSPARSPNNKRKARASDTSSNTSKASSNEYAWLQNASNVQLGPKRRSKAK